MSGYTIQAHEYAVEALARWVVTATAPTTYEPRHVHAGALAQLLELRHAELVGDDGWPTILGHDTRVRLDLLEQARERSCAALGDLQWSRPHHRCGVCHDWVDTAHRAAHESRCWPAFVR